MNEVVVEAEPHVFRLGSYWVFTYTSLRMLVKTHFLFDEDREEDLHNPHNKSPIDISRVLLNIAV